MLRILGNPTLLIIPLFFLTSFFSGCTTLVSAGATLGVAAVQERGIKVRAEDLKQRRLYLNNSLKQASN